VINEVEELGEARYLISKLYAMTVNQSMAVAQQEQANKNLEARMKQVSCSLKPKLIISTVMSNRFQILLHPSMRSFPK